MKTLTILLALVLASCSQVIGGPDRSISHGGHVIITTEKPHHEGKKPGDGHNRPRWKTKFECHYTFPIHRDWA